MKRWKFLISEKEFRGNIYKEFEIWKIISGIGFFFKFLIKRVVLVFWIIINKRKKIKFGLILGNVYNNICELFNSFRVIIFM